MRVLSCSARELADLAADVAARQASVRFVVRGASMVPALRTGDRVVVEPVDPGRLAPGDIVLINGARSHMHRAIRIDRDKGIIVTRGDALAQSDPPARLSDVVGRVVDVERPLGARVRWVLGACRRRVAAWLR